MADQTPELEAQLAALKADNDALRARLRAKERTILRLEEASDIARVGHWEWELANDTVQWSTRTFDIYGRDPASDPPSWSELESVVKSEDREAFADALRQLRTGDEDSVELEQRVVVDEKPRTVVVRCRLVRDESGAPHRVVGAVQDVTERRQLEAQLRGAQRMEAIGRLAGGIAHDFNNILAAIQGFGELVKASLDPASREAEDMDEVLDAAQRAEALTKQLLAFSRRRGVAPRDTDLNNIVRQTERMLDRVLGDEITLKTQLADDLWTACVDPTAIEQVLVNLAINARDAMPDGGRLTIETSNAHLDRNYKMAKRPQVDPGDYVCVAVADSGHGIADEVAEQIFEPFFTTRGSDGTGLGLSMCYGIVKQAGGYIWVYSEPGEGATFKIYLPRVRRQDDADDPSSGPKGSGDGVRVLVVDDDPSNARLAERILVEEGYTTLLATSAEGAINALQNQPHHVQLLLTDINLTRMTGMDLADRIRELSPRTAVLYMSGYTRGVAVSHGYIEPNAGFVQKPFTPRQLVKRVREYVEEADVPHDA